MIRLDCFGASSPYWEVRFDRDSLVEVLDKFCINAEGRSELKYCMENTCLTFVSGSFVSTDRGVNLYCRWPLDAEDGVLGISPDKWQDRGALPYEQIRHMFSEYGRWLDD